MPSLQDLYMDPKREVVKRDKRHTRYERMLISHRDPVFIRMLKEGGAVEEGSAPTPMTTSSSLTASTQQFAEPQSSSSSKKHKSSKSSSTSEVRRATISMFLTVFFSVQVYGCLQNQGTKQSLHSN